MPIPFSYQCLANRIAAPESKATLGVATRNRVADLSDIDQLITGPSASPEIVAEVDDLGVMVEIAEPG